MTTTTTSIPALGEIVPAFYAVTTNGTINFPEDYKGKWVILFSHPADFTPVCTTEIATFAALYNEFKALNTELIGLSVDSNSSHLAWLKEIEEKIRFNDYQGQKIQFPLIADTKGDIASLYGMISPNSTDSKACRTVFFIDPEGILRAMIYYPLSTGRNFKEIKRVIQALQTTDKYGVSTPADWQPGDDVLVAPPASRKEMAQREKDDANNGTVCSDWFFCTKTSEQMAKNSNNKNL